MEVFGTPALYWVIWLVTVACGVFFIINFKGTQSAVFGGIGFGILVGIPLLWQLFMLVGLYPWEFSFAFDILRLGGWALILVALIMLRRLPVGQAAVGTS
ncbi:hypothetical protein GF377_08110, partial [candidate division GN15 bacterium]|nr:hypothetical protein [candidate division GN15 bacterium]